MDQITHKIHYFFSAEESAGFSVLFDLAFAVEEAVLGGRLRGRLFL